MQTNDRDTSSLPRRADPSGQNAARPKAAAKPARLTSLDAYRGFIMLVLAGAGFGIAKVARQAIERGDGNLGLWRGLEYHFSHPEWISQTVVPRSLGEISLNAFGCSAWDLIQPSFMFMVGVAMVYSYAKRAARGDSRLQTATHVAVRSLVLVLLGVFLSSQWSSQTNWAFFNVLSQIGLGYGFVYLLLGRKFPLQLGVAALILVGYWAAFFFYPAPGADFDYASVGIGAAPTAAGDPAPIADEWAMPDRFEPWTKNVNLAADVDRWFLNLFPRSEPFEFNRGGYTTLNFIPSLFTMLLGVMAGQLLRGERRPIMKFALLVLAGLVCMLLGAATGATVCPVVKRIWTPSWALLSGAYVLWMLAVFYLVIDVIGLRRWSWPLVVVGTNSIAVYVMAQSMKGWVTKMLTIHFGSDLIPGPLKDLLLTATGVNFGQDGPYAPVIHAVIVLLVFWLICVWLYRQKIFIRV
jgi:heparan-alpha-glucosaminide N-acetyltransferase